MNALRRHLMAASLALAAYAFLPATAGAATLTISGCDSLTVVSPTEISCNAAPPSSPGAPAGCSALPSPLSLPAGGGNVNLSGSCTGGAAVASTTWTRSGNTVSSPDTLPSNAQGTSPVSYTYTARFCAADGTSCTNASRTVTVAAGATPAPGPGSCGNLTVIGPQAELNAQQKNLLFNGERYITSGFGSNTTSVVVARIDVPQGASGTAQLKINEYLGSAGSKRMWLSKTVCDFSGTGPYNPMATLRPVADIKVGGTPDATKVWMQPGETWFVMVKNESNWGTISSSCSTICDIALKLSTLTP